MQVKARSVIAPDHPRAPLDIAEVAQRTGLAPSALRYYERRGLIEPTGRNGLRRCYDPEVIDTLALIVAGRSTGFSLAELHDLLHAEPDDLRSQLHTKVTELDAEIDRLGAARALLGHALTCEHDSMLECPTFTDGLRSMLPDG